MQSIEIIFFFFLTINYLFYSKHQALQVQAVKKIYKNNDPHILKPLLGTI